MAVEAPVLATGPLGSSLGPISFYLFISGCAFSSLLSDLSVVVASGGSSLAAVHRLLTAVASPVVSAGFRAQTSVVAALRSCGTRA